MAPATAQLNYYASRAENAADTFPLLSAEHIVSLVAFARVLGAEHLALRLARRIAVVSYTAISYEDPDKRWIVHCRWKCKSHSKQFISRYNITLASCANYLFFGIERSEETEL